MSIKQEIIKDIIQAYKTFCNGNRLVESSNTAEYFIDNFVDMETKAGYYRAEKLRSYINK